MTQSKSRRRPLSLQALAWFIPGLVAVAAASLSTHPLTLILLLLANALTMAAICHAIGFDPEPRFIRTVLRRGAAYLVMFSLFTALVFVLVAWPMLQLSHAASLSAALLLAAALVLALAALWRLWAAFGLVFVWDDAYPPQRDGSWIFTATLRCMAFARHLSREERFFSHFLPTAVCLLALAFGAIALTGLVRVLPEEMRVAALAIYALVILPVACLVIANRTLRALLCERHRPRRRGDEAASVIDIPRPVLTESERVAGTPEQAAALLAATRDGDIERALALLEVGADPDTVPDPTDRDQRPVLMLAAMLPDTRLLRALIARGADVNRASGGITPLLAATRDSWHGRAEAVLTLLANGANPVVADADGNTPLHGAVLSADAGVAAMLLDAAAPIDALNQASLSPLATACRAANWPLAKYLLEHGAKPAPKGGEPALVAAASIADDDPAGVALLLKHRAPINALDTRRRHALLGAAAEGHEQIARALCAAGADVKLADEHGSTALMEAARAGASGIVQRLAEAKADALARDQHGRDALLLACQSPHADGATISALLALGAEAKTPGGDGRSALDHATAAGRWDLVALLDPDTACRPISVTNFWTRAPTRRGICSTRCVAVTGRPYPRSPNACRHGRRRNWPGSTWTWPRPVSAPPAAGCSTTAWTPKPGWKRRASMTPKPTKRHHHHRWASACSTPCWSVCRMPPRRWKTCCAPAPARPAPACWRLPWAASATRRRAWPCHWNCCSAAPTPSDRTHTSAPRCIWRPATATANCCARCSAAAAIPTPATATSARRCSRRWNMVPLPCPWSAA